MYTCEGGRGGSLHYLEFKLPGGNNTPKEDCVSLWPIFMSEMLPPFFLDHKTAAKKLHKGWDALKAVAGRERERISYICFSLFLKCLSRGDLICLPDALCAGICQNICSHFFFQKGDLAGFDLQGGIKRIQRSTFLTVDE